MRPTKIVELGTHNGFSYFAFCQAMRDLGLEGQVHAIDTWTGDPHAGYYGDDVYRSVAKTTAAEFPEIGEMHKMTFDEARPTFEKASVDILHIDGLHTYEAARHDFENWRETVRDGGVVLFHDTQVRRDNFGVWKLWEELRGEYPSFEFHHANGLGVLGVGQSFPDGLSRLFALSDDPQRAAQVRQQFERLGRSVELTDANATLSREYSKTLLKLTSTRNSWSWKITAPLRFVHANTIKFAWKLKLWLYFKALAIGDLPASLFGRRDLHIRYTLDGDQAGRPLSRVCVFVHFDKDGKVDPHVVRNVEAIFEAGFQVLFVSNAPNMTRESFDAIKPFCWRIIHRDNVGYDFGAWKTGILQIEDLSEIDALLICNDSVYGPLVPLDEVFRKMNDSGADFWGIVDSPELYPHLQSFFIQFNKPVLSSPVFQKFWRDFPMYKRKFRVILKGEVGLSKILQQAGFRMAALCRYEHIREFDRDRFDDLAALHLVGHANPTRYYWDILIRDMNCPYLKVDLVRDGLIDQHLSGRWEDVVAEVSDFDTDLIGAHAARVGAAGSE